MWFDTLAAGDGGEGAVYIQRKKEINSSAYIMRSILLNIYYYMY
jgi:hypothetical protein